MLKAPSVRALLAAVRLKAVKASHSKAFSTVAIRTDTRAPELSKDSGKRLYCAGRAAEGLAPSPKGQRVHVLRTGQRVSSVHLTAWMPGGNLDSLQLHFTGCACKSWRPEMRLVSISKFFRCSPAACITQRSCWIIALFAYSSDKTHRCI